LVVPSKLFLAWKIPNIRHNWSKIVIEVQAFWRFFMEKTPRNNFEGTTNGLKTNLQIVLQKV